MKFILLGVFSVFLVIFISGCVSTDKLITEGTAYGLSIGMTKKEVFNKLEESYKNDDLYMLGFKSGKGVIDHTHRELIFSEEQFQEIEPLKQWDIYLSKNFRNLLRLTFENGKLIQIYRHKKLMELP